MPARPAPLTAGSYNDEGQDYYLCERCEKFRDSFHLTDSSGGIA